MSRKRLIIGQRYEHLPFGTINGTMDDVDRLEARIGLPPGAAGWANVDGCNVLVCLALNTSEDDLVERAPAGVVQSAFELPDLDEEADGGDVATEVILNAPAIEIEPPSDDTEYWVITLGAIPAGETGLVAIMGLVAARVDVTDATHKFATFKPGDAMYLKSASSGAAIWDRKKKDVPEDPEADPPTTPKGKQWALVQIGGGGGGTLDLQFGRTTSGGTAATTYALDDAGIVTFQPLDDDGNPDGDEITVKIRYADVILINTPGYVINGLAFVPLGLNFGCNQLTP